MSRIGCDGHTIRRRRRGGVSLPDFEVIAPESQNSSERDVDAALTALGTVGLAVGLMTLWRARSAVSLTTLKSAWAWAMTAGVGWLAIWTSDHLLGLLDKGPAGCEQPDAVSSAQALCEDTDPTDRLPR